MSNETLPDRWHTRDLPVLREAARVLDDADFVEANDADILGRLDLTEDDVVRAFKALGDAEYLDVTVTRFLGGNVDAVATGLTERGRRAVGIWPNSDAAVEQLLSALRQAEDLTNDPDDKTALRKAGGQLATVSRSVLAEVIAAVVTRQAGL